MKPENTRMVQDKKENQNLLGDIQEPRMICEQFSTEFNLTVHRGQCREENMYHAIHIVW